jgi:hypothetical protein
MTRLLPLAPVLVLLAGCAAGDRNGPDPFFGGSPWRPPATPPTASAAPAAPPSFPTATSSSSTAALASGPSRPPDSRSGLQIGAPGPTAPVPVAPRPSEPPARLTGPAPPSLRLVSYEQAQVALLSRGVKWQRLEMTGDAGEWKFSCSLPSRQSASMSRTYEGRGPNYLAAMQAVLDQIEREGR